MRCPRCGSHNVYETWMVWAPKGKKSMRCLDCNYVWWEDVRGVIGDEDSILSSYFQA